MRLCGSPEGLARRASWRGILRSVGHETHRDDGTLTRLHRGAGTPPEKGRETREKSPKMPSEWFAKVAFFWYIMPKEDFTVLKSCFHDA